MKNPLVTVLVAALLLRASAQAVDVYFIDVEGGQATLFVTPSGESMLIDTAFRQRRPRRQPRPRRDQAGGADASRLPAGHALPRRSRR
jgi:hypothetical protein